MKRVALCIPTYERYDCIKDLLDNCGSYYLDYGIDIYLFDSSRTDAVEKFTAQEKSKYTDRLHYIKVPSELHTAEKTFEIYEGKGYPLDRYDYLWICSDALQFTKSAMEKIANAWKEDFDVIAVDPRDYDKIGSRSYLDANTFFGDCGWGMSLLGASILNVRSVLQGMAWEGKEQYLREKIIDFAHLSFIFHRILELPDFTGFHVSLEDREYRSSVYKKASGWYRLMFYIICESWVYTIESLPNVYSAKEKAIFRGGSLSLGTVRRFRELRMEGIFDLRVFGKYFSTWNKVCPIKKSRLLTIAVTPKAWLRRQYEANKDNLLQIFHMFKKKHQKVFIYGAGRVGTVYAMYFEQEHITFDGFCVSHMQEGKTSFLGYSLYGIDSIDVSSETGMIVALQEENARDVLKVLEERDFAEEHVFYSQDFYKMISFELGYRD